MRANRFLDEVMRDTANKEGLTFDQVSECVEAEFYKVRKSILEFNHHTVTGPKVIYLPCFGKYIIIKKTLENLYKLKERKEANETIQPE